MNADEIPESSRITVTPRRDGSDKELHGQEAAVAPDGELSDEALSLVAGGIAPDAAIMTYGMFLDVLGVPR